MHLHKFQVSCQQPVQVWKVAFKVSGVVRKPRVGKPLEDEKLDCDPLWYCEVIKDRLMARDLKEYALWEECTPKLGGTYVHADETG